jgi:hypothetical protein
MRLLTISRITGNLDSMPVETNVGQYAATLLFAGPLHGVASNLNQFQSRS